MNNTNLSSLPSLPPIGAVGPQVCEVMRLYLALWSDLTPEQQQIVSTHVRSCPTCTTEQELLNYATRLVRSSQSSSPSARVDQTVKEAIAARSRAAKAPSSITPFRKSLARKTPQRGTPLRLAGFVAAAAVLLFAVVASFQFVKISNNIGPQQAFVLPATLTWTGYILYHTETRLGKKGERYQVNSYHNLNDGSLRVETMQDGTLDVVAVSDTHKTLGLDMMHHVAQWDANAWMVDESMFDLKELRKELQTHRAVYLDKDSFKGKDVYRIRCDNGLVLLLDMHYMPVNVLRGAVGPGTGEPIYDTLQLMPPSHVSASMWDMSVPPGFTMGTLPVKP